MAQDRPHVLLVDDCRTVVTVVRHYLQQEGLQVLVARDGVAGLETAQRERPRVIITDMNMPGMDGLEMVRQLRADARTHEITIFMMSSDERAECRQRARGAGVDEYVLKPVEPKTFAAHVREAIERTVSAA
jgi:chemosensory pili system protein ChpA (sensor histidine kinase/response regulator)